MKDPTVPSPSDRKKIMFYDSAVRQTKLRIRCEFDGMTQSQFFRMMITGYIENDELIYSFINKCKEKYQIQGSSKRHAIEKFRKNTKDIKNKFSLGNDEIQSIFDIIEMDTDL